MGEVLVFNYQRSKAIEDAQYVDAKIVNDKLIFTRFDGTLTDAGNARGAKGDVGATGVGLNGTGLGSTLDLDTLKTTGLYFQGQSANATAANHYPLPTFAGMLEVYQKDSLTFQRYTVLNTAGPAALTIWVRGTTNSATAPVWSDWTCINLPRSPTKVNMTSNLNLTATQQDLPGAAITLRSVSLADVFFVTAVADVGSLGTTATLAILRLNVDNKDQDEQMLWNTLGIATNRAMNSQQWHITGLAPGVDHVFKLNGVRSGGADAMVQVRAPHTNLSVIRT